MPSKSGSAVHWGMRVITGDSPNFTLTSSHTSSHAWAMPMLLAAAGHRRSRMPPNSSALALSDYRDCAAKVHTAPTIACQERQPLSSHVAAKRHVAAPVRASELGYWLAPS